MQADREEGTTPVAKAAPERQSLVEFMKEKRRKACPVCSIPDEVREEMSVARNRKIKRPDVVEWLNTVAGFKVTNADLDAHYSGKHDVKEF